MWIRGTIYPTVLAAVIADLERMAAECCLGIPEWVTISGYSTRLFVPRSTLVRRLTAWCDHHQRRNTSPWSCPLSSPIYRYGVLPRHSRRGKKPGCWLLDVNRVALIRAELRNFSQPSQAENAQYNNICSKLADINIHKHYESWEQQRLMSLRDGESLKRVYCHAR
jgi:hypothetical protein